MFDISQSKCRYFAEIQVFLDFEEECKSNHDFLNFILNNFHIMSQGLNKEIANRTKEQSLLKSPLARQVREELLNYASIIKGSLIDRIKELFSVTSLEMKLVLERLEGVKEANKEHLTTSQQYYDFYCGKLKVNTNRMDSVSKEIKELRKKQTIKTRELEVRGRNMDRLQTTRFQSRKDILEFKISNLEKENKKFRSDAYIETERLSHSYEHLTNELIKQLKRSEDNVVDVVSSLLQDMEEYIKPSKREYSLAEPLNLDHFQIGTRNNGLPCFRQMEPVFEDTKDAEEESSPPYFPVMKQTSSQHVDSLFLSDNMQK